MQEISIYSIYWRVLRSNYDIFSLQNVSVTSLTVDYEIEVMIATENKIFRVPDNDVAPFSASFAPPGGRWRNRGSDVTRATASERV